MNGNDNDLFVFRRYRMDEVGEDTARAMEAAVDKLQTLYPGKRVTIYDDLTVGIESDSLYCESGIEMMALGCIDDELYALQRERDGEVITFRL